MSRLWLVAKHEYRQHVFDKSFLGAILSVPLLLVLIVGMGSVAEMTGQDGRPVGYVDHSGWLSEPVSLPAESRSPLDRLFEKPVSLLPYDTRETAHGDLEAGNIQAYYVLAEGYAQSRQVELVYIEPPGENATQAFRDFLQVNWLADQPAQISHRAAQGSTLIVRTPDGSRELVEGQVLGIILPILLSIAFMILFMATSFSLLQAVVQEKENRTMEILATSVSPEQLVAGKVLAVVAMGLTMFGAWIVLTSLGLVFAGRFLGVEWALQLGISPGPLAAVALVAIPSYVLYGGVMTALGATVADAQESQQLGGLVSLVFMLPFYAIVALVEQPNSPIAIALTLFPFTSLTTFCLRLAFSTWPAWQLAASLVILTLSALGSMWLAARAFRLGMLRYGKRLEWREIFQRRAAPRPSGAPAGRR